VALLFLKWRRTSPLEGRRLREPDSGPVGGEAKSEAQPQDEPMSPTEASSLILWWLRLLQSLMSALSPLRLLNWLRLWLRM